MNAEDKTEIDQWLRDERKRLAFCREKPAEILVSPRIFALMVAKMKEGGLYEGDNPENPEDAAQLIFRSIPIRVSELVPDIEGNFHEPPADG